MQTIQKSILLLIVAVLSFVYSYATEISIKDFGAKTEASNNALFIQKAIDFCSSSGGGTVYIPSGIYFSSTIYLKDNVNLCLRQGAVIKALADPVLYKDRGVVVGMDVENVAITGQGTVDGQGDHAKFQLGDNGGVRPHVVLFSGCRKVRVEDVSLVNSASWTLRLAYCDGVRVNNVFLFSHGNYNCDGIDVSSKNVLISDCHIDCDDDGICFKSEKEGYVVEHVVVNNCIISSNCNGIKFGTGSIGGFQNIAISNCVIHKASVDNIRKWQSVIPGISAETTVLAGIALEVVDGGFMDQITINNLSMQDVQTPLFIRLGNRKGNGTLKNVIISNIIAQSESLMTSSITGIPGHRVENVTVKDVIFKYRGGVEANDIPVTVPEKENSYPENRMFGPVLPAYGLYIRHADNLVLENIQCYLQSADARPAFVFDDVHHLFLRNFRVSKPSGDGPVFYSKNCLDAVIDVPVLMND